MQVLEHVKNGDGSHYGYRFHCPGCGLPHVIPTKPTERGWDFDGNMEAPTFSPSILCYGSANRPQCHSWVRAGMIEFFADSSHALAGKTVPLPDVNTLWRED